MLGMNPEQQILLTQKVMFHLEEWGLSAAQQIMVLDLPDDAKSRRLRAYHENTPFPDTAEVEYRVIRLLGIIDALRTTYPTNPLMASRWIKSPHKRLENRTPQHGMQGRSATTLADAAGGALFARISRTSRTTGRIPGSSL